MKRFIFSIILTAFAFLLQAQAPFKTQSIDSLMQLLEANDKMMVSVNIMKEGQSFYSKAIGFRDIEKQLKNDANTVFRIGSISKMFTSVMILQLVEEGKLRTDDKLASFFPEIPESENITIEQMLRHRTGIFNITNDSLYLTYNTAFQTKEKMLQRIAESERVFQPDEKTEYSNSNYILLGYILEKITGKAYQVNLQERIAGPLGLKSTNYGSKIISVNNEAISYRFDGKWIPEDETDMSVPGGAGALVSTPTELNHFITALFTNELLSESSMEAMTKLVNNFGYGIFAMPFYENKALGHTGGIDGFRSSLLYFPAQNMAVALCVNGSNYNPNDLLIGVLSVVFEKDYEFPSFEIVEINAETLSKYPGVYSAKDFPLKIEISLKENQLFAQATGQQAFPLDAIDESNFKFDAAGIKINFSENTLTLKQGGMNVVMTREN
ncbi:MAG: serine hydrolase domain-containing protein [Bacteroidales bacterium]|nr:serine hydrolase domain-containing protein [Bacteroidales bacterium]MDP2237262.1 serine hydrolase domain-containing protein [Bacteroidales bacterium]